MTRIARWAFAVSSLFLLSILPYYAGAGGNGCVVIIGAGIAGLSARHELARQGICSVVFERADRTGGRISTYPVADGLYVNGGAEFVDTTNPNVLGYMREFNIPTLQITEPEETQPGAFIYQGKSFTGAEVMDSIFDHHADFVKAAIADKKKIDGALAHGVTAPRDSFDQMGVNEYLAHHHADDLTASYFRAYLEAENGMPAEKQSALAFLTLFTFHPDEKTVRFHETNDEAYRVLGGTQKITDALTNADSGEIDFGYKLVSVSSTDQVHFTLGFETPNGLKTIAAQHGVICTIPMPDLKNVKLDIKGMPSTVTTAIQNTTYGKHTKLFMIFNKRLWTQAGHTGDVLTDQGFQIFDSSQGLPGENGILTAYIGDTVPAEQTEAKTREVLATLEKLFPGISKTYVGARPFPHEHSYTGKVGIGELSTLDHQPTEIGMFKFAGEEIPDVRAQRGYMEGAIRTAKDAVTKLALARSQVAGCITAALQVKPHAPSAPNP